MPLDVRLPIGGLFLVVGLLLFGHGMVSEGWSSMAGRVNVIWGGVMAAVGLVLGHYGLRAEREERRR